ncbi:homeobox domain-containing protein, partial [Actinobacillus pleuropneumoniae]|uniref:homeobox domain-containing protein n=1 Tax=Actinobacillus pleuropneumoniae TaxID=715 RepID=UPI00227A3E9C
QCNNFAMTYAKCDTKDTICNDYEDTCASMLETLEMSETHVYMVIKTHLHKYYPSKQQKISFVQRATLDMRKVDTLIFF